MTPEQLRTLAAAPYYASLCIHQLAQALFELALELDPDGPDLS